MRFFLAAAAAFATATAPYVFHFPNDHASHPAFQSEWWYFTGHLRASDGHHYGYEVTFFRVRLRPNQMARAQRLLGRSRWRGDQIYAAHFAITDVDGRKFLHTERVARSALGLGAAATNRLAVNVDEWSLQGSSAANGLRERMTLVAADGGNRLNLTQTPEKNPAVHGRDGIFRKGPCPTCASRYYSYSRLSTSGSLTYNGKTARVSGTSWMDHEFGTDQLLPEEMGWDWFSIQLDDGRELMLYLFRHPDGTIMPQSSGSLIERNGSVRPLSLNEFRIDATSHWRSAQTHANYPSAWRVQVPAASLDLTLTPVLANQELIPRTGPSYWEGAVEVRTTRNARPAGQGYVELTGYSERVQL